MKINGTNIVVYRGEQFTLDFEVRNRDGSPFLLSSKYREPYFTVNVTSSTYKQAGDYSRTFWLPCGQDVFAAFYETSCKELESWDLPEGEPMQTNYRLYYVVQSGKKIYKRVEAFIDMEGDKHIVYTTDYDRNEAALEDGTEVEYEMDSGTYTGNVLVNNGSYELKTQFVDYEPVRVIAFFPSSITKEWRSQSYKYNIMLVTRETGESDTYLYSDFNIESVIVDNSKISVLPPLYRT